MLEAHGYTVISRDLYDRGYGESGHDFLAATSLPAEDLVTNPPYHDDLPEKFVLHALKRGARKVALLCRLTWLEGLGRNQSLFSERRRPNLLCVVHLRAGPRWTWIGGWIGAD
jgi:hypothetical protein